MIDSLERAWQQRLDSMSRVNEKDEFTCESCGQTKDMDDCCEHDWYTIHNWCQGCCEDQYEEDPDNQRMMWEDLD